MSSPIKQRITIHPPRTDGTIELKEFNKLVVLFNEAASSDRKEIRNLEDTLEKVGQELIRLQKQVKEQRAALQGLQLENYNFKQELPFEDKLVRLAKWEPRWKMIVE